ncbi:DUF1858 domain-containing protein [Patescibacteria group bacterium]|nr:DUF1858 domain-containing protein [Patescibacteria group bacterium]
MPKFNEESLIGDILRFIPEAAEVLEDYGMQCISCSIGSFESIGDGAFVHGLSDKELQKLLKKLNDLAKTRFSAPKDGIYLTLNAAEHIREFAAAEGKEGYGLRIIAPSNKGEEPLYKMDFAASPRKTDKTFEFHNVKLFISPSSLKNLLGSEIDFLQTPYGSGFKIYNPNF